MNTDIKQIRNYLKTIKESCKNHFQLMERLEAYDLKSANIEDLVSLVETLKKANIVSLEKIIGICTSYEVFLQGAEYISNEMEKDIEENVQNSIWTTSKESEG